MNASITLDQPAHMDERLYLQLLRYLEEKNIGHVVVPDFRNACVVNGQVISGQVNVSDCSHFFWIGMLDRSFESYHLEVLRRISDTVETYNSWQFYSIATDKYLTSCVLRDNGIPVPDSCLVNRNNFQEIRSLFDGRKWLLKPRRSSFGQGIILLNDYEQLRDIIEYHGSSSYYLEEFMENSMEDWTGITVVGGKVLYAFRKDASLISGWKVYDADSKGGGVKVVRPEPEQEKIALKIGSVMGGHIYGLDMIRTERGWKVVDVNCSPGLYIDFINDLGISFPELYFSPLNLH